MFVKSKEFEKISKETITKLLDEPLDKLKFIIEQKDILESNLTDKEKIDPLIQTKFKALNETIQRFQKQIDKMADDIKKTSGQVSKAYEDYKNSIAKNTNSYMS